MFSNRYTQASPDLIDTTNLDSLYLSHFNPAHPTKVIIHGFQGGRNLAPSTDLRDGRLPWQLKSSETHRVHPKEASEKYLDGVYLMILEYDAGCFKLWELYVEINNIMRF